LADKTASGIIVYLQEELGDARLRAQQLTASIKAALDLVEESSHRDHFFEVAGHLIHGIPDTAFKLGKALDAAALAAAKLDYEEIKQGLKPEKVEELEAALDDVRLRYLNRRSNEEPMNPKTTADTLNQLAVEIDATGHVPVAKLARLIGALERGQKRASDQPKRAAAVFRGAAKHLLTAAQPSKVKLAMNLRRILAESQMDPPVAGAGEEFQKKNPKITDEQVEKINDEHEKNKDVIKDKAKEASDAWAAGNGDFPKFKKVVQNQADDMLRNYKGFFPNLRAGAGQIKSDGAGKIRVDVVTLIDNDSRAVRYAVTCRISDSPDGTFPIKWHIMHFPKGGKREDFDFDSVATLDDIMRKGFMGLEPAAMNRQMAAWMKEEAAAAKTARFEQGKPADPTEQMSPEDAEKWKQMNDKYKDVVKDKHQ